VTDPHVAAQRLRAYLQHLPNAVNLGAEIVWGDEFTAGDRPHRGYALDRADLEAVLDELAQLRSQPARLRVTNHTYEGTPGPGNPCAATLFGETCRAAWEQHELRDCVHDDSTETWFDRTVCPESCGLMHDRCTECGEPIGGCRLLGEPDPCPCCTFGNHTEPCTCDGTGCCHPDRHRAE
jgi:hypothetical protein